MIEFWSDTIVISYVVIVLVHLMSILVASSLLSLSLFTTSLIARNTSLILSPNFVWADFLPTSQSLSSSHFSQSTWLVTYTHTHPQTYTNTDLFSFVFKSHFFSYDAFAAVGSTSVLFYTQINKRMYPMNEWKLSHRKEIPFHQLTFH